MFAFFFGSISATAARTLVAVFFLGWLVGMTAALSAPAGTTSPGHPGCPYALNDHGSIECVSRSTYEKAGSSEERFAAGVLTAFFAFQLAAAAGEVNRRRREGPSPSVIAPT